MNEQRPTMPTRSLIDRRNPAPYVPAAKTDIRATFAKVRKMIAEKKKVPA